MATIPKIYVKNSYDEYLEIEFKGPNSVKIEGWCDQRFLTTNPPANFENVKNFLEKVIEEIIGNSKVDDLSLDLSKTEILDSRIFKILKTILVEGKKNGKVQITIVSPKKKFQAIVNMYVNEFQEKNIQVKVV